MLDPTEAGARARAARAYADLNRDELARKTGLRDGVLKRLEAGTRLSTTVEELRKIAAACGVPEAFMVAPWFPDERPHAARFAEFERDFDARMTALKTDLAALRAGLEQDQRGAETGDQADGEAG